jgi:type I restriction enzyme S subunit
VISKKDLPQGWELVKLKDLGKIVTGNTPSKSNSNYYGGKLPWIKTPDLKTKYISNSVDTISEEGRKVSRILPKGSVMVSCIGNIGQVGIANCEVSTNQQINSIIPNLEIVIPEFIYYSILLNKEIIAKKASKAVLPLLNKTNFSQIEIILPPLETQKKIVEILEKAEEVKNKRETLNDLTEECLDSIFYEIFGNCIKNEKKWEIKRIKEILKIPLNSGWSPKCNEEMKKYPVLTLGNLNDSGLNLNITKYFDSNQEIKKGQDLKINDLLISRSNTPELVGRIGRLKNDIEDLIYPDLMIRMRVNENIIKSQFLEFLMRTNSFRCIIKSSAKGSSKSMVKISQGTINEYNVIIPPIELQNKFADIVEQVEKLKEKQLKTTEYVEELFDALMQKAFRGELV